MASDYPFDIFKLFFVNYLYLFAISYCFPDILRTNRPSGELTMMFVADKKEKWQTMI
jgi:hypothetical protein